MHEVNQDKRKAKVGTLESFGRGFVVCHFIFLIACFERFVMICMGLQVLIEYFILFCSIMDAENKGVASPPSVDYGDGEEDEPSTAGGPDSTAASHVVPVETETKPPEETMRPRRVEQALKEAKTFEDYRKKRPFKFLHMYSGPNDPLGQAIKFEAAKNRLNVVVLSLDNQLDPGLDLADPGGFQIMKEDVGKGEWDYLHRPVFCN